MCIAVILLPAQPNARHKVTLIHDGISEGSRIETLIFFTQICDFCTNGELHVPCLMKCNWGEFEQLWKGRTPVTDEMSR